MFGGGVNPPAPLQTKIQNSVSIESECFRFRRFPENLVEIGLVDSETWLKKKISTVRKHKPSAYGPANQVTREEMLSC